MTRKTTKKAGTPRKSKKSDEAEITYRVNEVYKKLIQRSTRADILQYAAKEWQVNTRQTDTYIARATVLIKQQAAYDRDTELVMAVELMKYVIRKTLGVMDYQRTISAQREISNMLGLYAPQKSDNTIHIIDESAVIADLRRRVEAGELTREELLYATDNNTTLADELFRGAAHRVSTGKDTTSD